MDSFPHRFSQPHLGLQTIIHINDLNLMRQTSLAHPSQVKDIFEIQHPNYLLDFMPNESDSLQ